MPSLWRKTKLNHYRFRHSVADNYLPSSEKNLEFIRLACFGAAFNVPAAGEYEANEAGFSLILCIGSCLSD